MVNDTTQSELLHNLLSLLAKSAETDREREIYCGGATRLEDVKC